MQLQPFGVLFTQPEFHYALKYPKHCLNPD